MNKSVVTIIFITVLLLSGLIIGMSEETSNTTIYVDDDNIMGPWEGTLEHPYQYIQDAIENASSGDTIRVYAGTYNNPSNNIYITKTLNIIGNGSDDTFVKRPVCISTNDMIFIGFTVNASDYASLEKVCCIKLKDSHHCDINNNTITGSFSGLELYNSEYNNVEDNIVLKPESEKPNIYLCSSNNNKFRKNKIYSYYFGIYLDSSRDNSIEDNKIVGPDSSALISYCVYLLKSFNTSISNNDLTIADWSMGVLSSDYNTIKGNIMKSSWGAIRIYSSNHNVVRENILSQLEYGISLKYSSNNTIDKNLITNNDGPGVGLFHESESNVVSRNILNNTRVGVALGGSSNNIIQLNDITNNSHGGISFNEETNCNTICQNNIQRNGDESISWTGGIIFSGKNYGNKLFWNNIEDNKNCGINASYSLVDARFNWWGSPLGPSRTSYMLRGERIISKISMVKTFPWIFFPKDIATY